MKHDECNHPATPAARAKCRKERAAGTTSQVNTDKAPKVLRDLLTLDDGPVKVQNEKRFKGHPIPTTTPDRVKVSKHRDDRDPDLIDCVARLRKFVERRDWDAVIHTAWDKGWKIRNDGTDTIGRIYIDGSKGQVMIAWGRTEANENSTRFTFRPWDTSIYRPVASVAIAFSLAEGR